MTLWIVVLVVGAASLALRALPLLASDAVRLGPRAREGLRHAGIGAIAALLVASLLPHGAGPAHPDVAMLVALAVGAGLALRGASMLVVVAAGAAAHAAVSLLGIV